MAFALILALALVLSHAAGDEPFPLHERMFLDKKTTQTGFNICAAMAGKISRNSLDIRNGPRMGSSLGNVHKLYNDDIYVRQ